MGEARGAGRGRRDRDQGALALTAFLKDRWYCAAESRELGREPLGRVFLGEPVVLYRKEDGTPVALEDRCCHRYAPLHRGRIEGDRIRCGYHGFLYDPGGACVWVPGQSRVPPDARLCAWPLVERHGWIWIWMGAPARANAATIPDWHENADPGWVAVGGLLPLQAHYMLLVDNLLDLSHLAFLHAATIGSAEDTDPELACERGQDRVTLTRIVRDIPPSPRMQAEGIAANVDQTKVMTYTPAANVRIDIATTEAGRTPGAPGGLDQRMIIFDAITPETETSCHYFWGSARNYDLADADYTGFIERMTLVAFNEDKDMLEALQRNLARGTGRAMVDVTGDVGALEARRLLDRLIAEEGSAARQTA